MSFIVEKMDDDVEVQMKNHADVIIVGARCAGSTLALELGRAGMDVLLLDQGTFPSDTLSTHTFFNNTVHLLKELGVMGALEKRTTAPPVRRVVFQFDEIRIEGDLPAVHGEQRNYCIRRRLFDQVLLESAASLDSVRFLEGIRVYRLLKEGKRVTGVEGVTRSGETVRFTADWVVGADGRNSTVRKALGIRPLRKEPTDFAMFYSYLRHLESFGTPRFEVIRIKGRTLVIFPTDDGLHVAFVAFPLEERAWLEAFRQNPQEAYFSFLRTQFREIRFEQRMRQATLADRVRGLTGFDNFWYPAMGNGWALVGDAVIFKDPGVAQGMHDAILGARILARMLQKYDWHGEYHLMKAAYERELTEKLSELFELALVMTKHRPVTPEQRVVHRIVSTHPEAAEKFLGLYNHTCRMAEFQQTVRKIARGR
jgi:2-polyprenyl-6-methoxyphenol hydroxylase-like FAD-dependent oxidoreductase